MARTLELTWQKGSETRAGRWRKKFLGKSYYFDGGSGKSDREAYKKAMEKWKELRTTLEGARPTTPSLEYAEAIAEWSAVRDWAVQNEDTQYQLLAQKKVDDLQKRLSAKRVGALEPHDRFLSLFKIPTIEVDEEAIRKAPMPTTVSVQQLPFERAERERLMAELDGTPLRIAQEIWKDRIQSQQRRSSTGPDSVGANVVKFLEGKRLRVTRKQISAGRFANISLHLKAFEQFVGEGKVIAEIGEDTLTAYHTELLRKVGPDGISTAYAKDRLDIAKMFIRWSWRQKAIDQLPRNIDDPDLSITVSAQRQTVFMKSELKRLLKGASDRLRLYILLGLNCGMTQVDISDLLQDEVNWRKGTITRKRSKTGDHENVPEVTYVLWQETFRLLKVFRAKSHLALLNESGGPLKAETLHEDGRLRKVDSIHTAFFRLCTELKITRGTFKTLKKTSATLLKNNKSFSGLEDLFLGHAPRKLSDRNYTVAPQELLAKALEWLGKQYTIK